MCPCATEITHHFNISMNDPIYSFYTMQANKTLRNRGFREYSKEEIVSIYSFKQPFVILIQNTCIQKNSCIHLLLPLAHLMKLCLTCLFLLLDLTFQKIKEEGSVIFKFPTYSTILYTE